MKLETFSDLFCGIGGFHSALAAEGLRCVGACDMDAACRETYEANHGFEPEGDIRELHNVIDHGEECDVVCAGFPCQSFSRINTGAAGMEDARGMLFYEVVRVVKLVKPKVVICENVDRILVIDGGRVKRAIYEAFDEAGYELTHCKLYAKDFGVPQQRGRIFFVGIRKDLAPYYEFTPPEPTSGPVPLSSILHPEDGSEEPEAHYTLGAGAQVNPRYIVKESTWQHWQERGEELARRGYRFRYWVADVNKPSRALLAHYAKWGATLLVPYEPRPRKLTPRECARMMGFGDEFKPHPKDTHAYRQFGNAVVPQVVSAVFKSIREKEGRALL